MTETTENEKLESGEPLCPVKKTSIGGQALIEGVMMRGPQRTAMAVRHVSGEIVQESWPTSGQNRAAIWKVPFIRGIYNLVDSMRFGYKCLMRSAEMAGLEDEEDAPSKKKEAAAQASAQAVLETEEAVGTAVETELREALGSAADEVISDPLAPAGQPTDESAVETAAEITAPEPSEMPASPQPAETEKAEKAEKKKNKAEDYLMSFLMVLSSLLGVCLAVFLFMWLPSQLVNWLKPVFPAMENRVVRGVFEGVCKIALFIGYVSVVSLMKDIRRVFMYHGAEHKTIFCYEKGLPLTVENVRMQGRFHPRCGTSFMILMLLIGIIVAIFIPGQNAILRTFFKLLTLPVVVGIGYELIKLAGRKDNLLTRIISAPGLWVQRITTKEPDDSMIECAIAALKAVIPDDPEADRW